MLQQLWKLSLSTCRGLNDTSTCQINVPHVPSRLLGQHSTRHEILSAGYGFSLAMLSNSLALLSQTFLANSQRMSASAVQRHGWEARTAAKFGSPGMMGLAIQTMIRCLLAASCCLHLPPVGVLSELPGSGDYEGAVQDAAHAISLDGWRPSLWRRPPERTRSCCSFATERMSLYIRA